MTSLQIDKIINELCERYPVLISCKNNIAEAAEIIIGCYSSGGKLLVCGNGGSAADADHLVGELMKSFEVPRPLNSEMTEKLSGYAGEEGSNLAVTLEGSLPAISLSSQIALTTAISNDIGYEFMFAQQVIGYGKNNDILIAISCSGNSMNVVNACITAKALDLKVIGLTAYSPGKMEKHCDILIAVPEKATAPAQELHLPVLHTICRIIESQFYKG